MNVAPNATFEAVIDTGETGLVGTVTVEANDNTGVTAIASTASGIVEIAAGVYAATGLAAPAAQGQYTLIWKSGAEVLGVEDLTVTYTAPAEPAPTPPSLLYVTVAELKTALSLGAAVSYADEDLAASAEAASRAVDGITGTRFYPGTPGEVRYYTPVSEEYLLIDDASAVTAVAANGTAIVLGSAYVQTGTPVTSVLRSLNGYQFPRGTVNGVAVTGTFGWPAPPADVKRATLILATRIFKRSREAPLGVVGFEIDGSSARIPRQDPDVLTLLAPYTRSGMVE